ncbi:MAG TPA: 6-phosphogluconolactonase, partial [Kofleriaceae bacterium]|nr:6-phosphogluconolactonase [Kofleriaceae bacterium]
MSAVRTFADLDALTRATADELVALAAAAVAERGRFHLALSGGSTPRRLFQHLAARPTDVPWDKVEL